MTDATGLHFKDRYEWRDWLNKNHAAEKEIWLVYYKKHTGKPTVAYEEAVEEAICFGWIDGKVKRIDDERFMQRYTPRTAKSPWSERNIKRAKDMIATDKMTPAGLELYRNAMKAKRVVPTSNNFSVPQDLQEALAAKPRAAANFKSFAPSARLLFAYWVDNAKRETTRRDRIKKSLELLAQNKKLTDM